MMSAAAGLLLFATVGQDTAYFPTVFFACFLIGMGIGNAFMPLLTLAMADVPAADAGLGSGITNVSQQISGALGLAVLSTIATEHTKSLLSDGQAPAGALIGGYQVAFITGAVADRRRDPARPAAPAAAQATPADARRASRRRPRPRSRHGGTSRMTRHALQDPRRLRGRRRVLHPRHLVPRRAIISGIRACEPIPA